ncbi:TolC family protein [Moraxella sp. ZY210820]|uniref:TolC family protein n=1 Tax=unclassified Moraxella TaxID=2685852 RepID=UPI002731C7D1|nr:TolC family protein [Moraxella sp. ZY210820]WLF84287.1 TolC family protein [Moraxella sp. ZY210820]
MSYIQKVLYGILICPIAVNSYAIDFYNIEQLIELTLTQHPTIQSVQAEQQVSELQTTIAKAQRYPTLSTQSQYNQDKQLHHQINIRQTLWSGGQITADIQQAQYKNQASHMAVLEQKYHIAKNTIDVWQNYIQADSVSVIYKTIIQDLHRFKAMMQRRVQQGVSAPIELELINNRILLAQTQYDSALEQKRVAQLRLIYLVGHKPYQDHTLFHHNSNIKQILMQQAEADLTMIKHKVMYQYQDYTAQHPTSSKLDYQIKAQQKQLESVKAQRYPTIYTQWSHEYQPNATKHYDQSFSIGMTFNTGAGLSKWIEPQISTAQIESLKANQQANQRQLEENLQTQYQQFIHDYQQIKLLKLAIKDSQMVSESYQRQFLVGRKSWLEILNAIREHMDYQAQLIQFESSFLAQYFRLKVDLNMMTWQNEVTEHHQ